MTLPDPFNLDFSGLYVPPSQPSDLQSAREDLDSARRRVMRLDRRPPVSGTDYQEAHDEYLAALARYRELRSDE